MRHVAPIVLLVGLVLFIGSHLAIVVQLARGRAWARAALALALPPLAPWWAWELGMRRAAYAWVGSLAAYTVGVALT